MTNVVSMRMPESREQTPEVKASLCKASVKAVREKLADHSRVSVKTWIYIGEELQGVQRSAGTSFRSMFTRNAKRDQDRYPFSHATGHLLIEIAKYFGAATIGSTDKLPISWRTLYELTKLSPIKLERHIETGAVHPMMTRADARKLHTPKSAKKHLKPKIKSTPDAWTTKVKKTDPLEARLEAVFELMARLKLKLDDLE